jgi:hypothetical protein
MCKNANRMSALGTTCTFFKKGTCSETLCHVLNRAFHKPLELEENAVMPLAGGIKQTGYQCGMLWGSALAAGAQAGRVYGAGPEAETRAVLAAQKVVRVFRDRYKNINCLEITESKMQSNTQILKFLMKGGPVTCFRMAAGFAPLAHDAINTALSDKQPVQTCHPASCAALLAKKTGLSRRHTVMAAGLAGGIGLCGGACGALGAAVWIIGMNIGWERGAHNLWKDDFFNARFELLMKRFMKSTGHVFECSEITGKVFETVAHHSEYLLGGGCSQLINTLAEVCKPVHATAYHFKPVPRQAA